MYISQFSIPFRSFTGLRGGGQRDGVPARVSRLPSVAGSGGGHTFAISNTYFKLAMPMVSVRGFVVPFNLPFFFSTPAAINSMYDVAGVRSSKWNERSGRTVMRGDWRALERRGAVRG